MTGPNNDEMLELYGLFKQAKVGDNNTRERRGLAASMLAAWAVQRCCNCRCCW